MRVSRGGLATSQKGQGPRKDNDRRSMSSFLNKKGSQSPAKFEASRAEGSGGGRQKKKKERGGTGDK